MRPLEKLNFLITTYGRLLVAMFNARLWPPYLIYMLVMLFLVVIIEFMFKPLFAGWVVPLAVAVTGDAVLHYPQHILYMPYILERFNLVPSLLLESLLNAAAVFMFASYFLGERVSFGNSLRRAAKFYPKLLLIWLVNFVLVYLLFETLPSLFHDVVSGSPKREMALTIGMQGLSILFSSLFVYVVPYLVLQQRKLGNSFVRSFSLFFRNFFTTYFYVFIPNIAIIILILLFQNGDQIIGKFHPRIMVGLTYIEVFFMIAANFFTTGAIVRFFLEVAEE